MGFLDNLESNLKAMESREERDPDQIRRDEKARDSARAAALATAPYAEALKSGPFADALFTHCRRIGHGQRILVRITWIEYTLRLEAKEKTLELRPTPEGVRAHFFEDGRELSSQIVDLTSDPETLARQWLG